MHAMPLSRITAFDTRPVVAEQVQSLGAKFLDIDLGETGQTADGYARELTPEQIQIQREAQKSTIAESDVVITTAQVFGRKAPLIVTRDMVEGMAPGSVVVDMAAETGGNVEGSVANQVAPVTKKQRQSPTRQFEDLENLPVTRSVHGGRPYDGPRELARFHGLFAGEFAPAVITHRLGGGLFGEWNAYPCGSGRGEAAHEHKSL